MTNLRTVDQLRALERGFEATADDGLSMLALADRASTLLAEVVLRAPVQPRDRTSTPAELQREALWFMAVLAFRAARAATAVLRTGYEEQAIVYVRVIDELFGRAKKTYEDESGTYAQEWLKGRGPGKGAKVTGQDFWEMLSRPAHGDVRSVFDWLAIPFEKGPHHVILGPERRPEVANSTLVYIAGELRDVAAMLAVAAQVSVTGLETLTADIAAAQDKTLGPDPSPRAQASDS